MRYVYLDTETTGFQPGQICELSMIIEQDKKFIGASNYFFTVDSMDEGAEQTHGFSMESLRDLSGGARFADKHKEILEQLKDSTIVAHNVSFDERFLVTEFGRCGIKFKPSDKVCTMEEFKKVLRIPAKNNRFGSYKNPKLTEVLDFLKINTDKVMESTEKLFGITKNSFHDSKFDTTAMFVAIKVYLELTSGGHLWSSKYRMMEDNT